MFPRPPAIVYYAKQQTASSKQVLKRTDIRYLNRTYDYLRRDEQERYALGNPQELETITLHLTV